MPSFCLQRGQRSCVFPAYILNLLKFPVLLRLSGSFMNVFCFSEAVSTCSLRLKEHENGLEIYRCFRVHLRWIQGLWKKGRRPGGTAQFTFLADPISPVCCYSSPIRTTSSWQSLIILHPKLSYKSFCTLTSRGYPCWLFYIFFFYKFIFYKSVVAFQVILYFLYLMLRQQWEGVALRGTLIF